MEENINTVCLHGDQGLSYLTKWCVKLDDVDLLVLSSGLL